MPRNAQSEQKNAKISGNPLDTFLESIGLSALTFSYKRKLVHSSLEIGCFLASVPIFLLQLTEAFYNIGLAI